VRTTTSLGLKDVENAILKRAEAGRAVRMSGRRPRLWGETEPGAVCLKSDSHGKGTWENCELEIPWCEKLRHRTLVCGSGVTLDLFGVSHEGVGLPRLG
jgi:hypothetical protein